MIRIVVDSTCDLPAESLEQHNISVVPINIQFGAESYEDGVTLDRAGFYAKVEELGTLPTTSQPSAGQFAERYRRLAEGGATDIISVHVTAKLSGTLQSAELAKEMVEGQVRVHPFDSACASAGLGFMAVETARMADRGSSVAEILARLETMRAQMNLVFTLKELRFAQMSGRVGKLQGSLASLLDIKPIVLLEDGIVDVIEQVRSRRKAIDHLLEIMVERVGSSVPVNLAVIQADTPQEGHQLLERARSLFNCRETFVTNLTTTLLVHLGPGTLGLIAYPV